MTYINTRLAGFALALGLLALPLAAAASVDDLRIEYAHHRYFFSEEGVGRLADEPTAEYAMLEMTALEEVAGRQHLDMSTIKFLEENTWDRVPVARPQGTSKAVPKLLDQETIRFLEGNFWDYQPMASFAVDSVDEGIVRPWHCFGEGLVDPGNQVIVDIRDGLVARYCSGHAYVASQPSVSGRDLQTGVYSIDIGFSSNEIPWQDSFEPVAVFADTDISERPVVPFEEPQLRADEPL